MQCQEILTQNKEIPGAGETLPRMAQRLERGLPPGLSECVRRFS